MLSTTISSLTFTATGGAVTGLVTCAGNTATFTPAAPLASNTLYTATITTGAADLAGNVLAVNKVWTFTTVSAVAALGPGSVILRAAGNYAILAKTAISNVATSAITGNMGLSPAATTFVTGFVMTPSAAPISYTTTSEVLGYVYAADMAGGSTSSDLGTAVGAMLTAYTDAAGRSASPIANVGAGTIGGDPAFATFTPGLYNWNTGVHMTGGITLSGGANDTWIFQVNGTLVVDAAKLVTLTGGALAKNIIWQVTGATTFSAGSHFEGIVLCASDISLLTGATMNGRALSNTQVVLQMATVTQPAP